MDAKEDFLERWNEVLVECRDCARRYAGREFAGQACPGCGGELAAIPPPQLAPHPDEAAVEVYRAPDMPQAEIIRAYLESEGLRVAFRSAATWGVHTFTVDGLGEVGILALESEAERARKLIEQCLGQTGDEEQPEPEEPT